MTNRIYPHTPTIKAARLKFTLILLTLLFIGKYAKADVPCQTAIEVQQATIDSLQAKLATAQSVPYNQGYQEGYKVANIQHQAEYEKKGTIVLSIVIGGFLLAAFFNYLVNRVKL